MWSILRYFGVFCCLGLSGCDIPYRDRASYIASRSSERVVAMEVRALALPVGYVPQEVGRGVNRFAVERLYNAKTQLRIDVRPAGTAGKMSKAEVSVATGFNGPEIFTSDIRAGNSSSTWRSRRELQRLLEELQRRHPGRYVLGSVSYEALFELVPLAP